MLVLVVEDEPLIGMMLDDWLEEMGHEILGPAATPAQALEILAGSHPHAAIVDVNLRGQRSDAVARELGARGIPFLLASGDPAHAVTGATAVGTLKKPFRFEDFKTMIDRIVAASDLRREI